ncbi:MAG: lipoyl(octanoyl) transferase LipB [Bacillati bacterium ANGP1]|uniref:Octanoyltransferase n=1 Tax=Candidatus Segetimicrobium genomatis TaxID=2569760 RepID=A0A537L7V9_9BACT|nr:MAG: lipoyl(octanoyl) transferase LipB [Terrabacteria group bacterium ANGP1]TMJ13083.1 MAG: lipoyl(octanoyl) transferase LipB [Terrabacteria group bacterium ANGP1]
MSRKGWLLNLREGPTPYADAWALQKALIGARQREELADGLILLEHEPVFTIGRSARADHLLVPREFLTGKGFEVYDIERGGSVTYHGPGQLVGYPILDLRAYNEDVVKYVRSLEETILRTLQDFGLAAQRLRGFPGVWAGHEKIAAVGVAVKRKVTMHGFALNVGPDLAPFDYINPCGIGRPVTSMARLLGRPLPVDEVRLAYARRFAEVFDLTLGAVAREDLLRAASGYAAASA